MTVPTRHHTPGQLGIAITATVAMAVLFLLFERGFLWLASILAFFTLFPFVRDGSSPRQVFWKAFIAGVLVAVGVFIWLT